MASCAKVLVITALLGVAWSGESYAAKETVCTITVNSSNEKEAFRRSLPPDRFQFVELVDRGRPDWLASACLQGIHCDVLVISGHYDGRDEFYSDQPDAEQFLPADEMERASCSKSCSALFSQLKEVYLFGCNTLNPEALKHTTGEIGRSLIRAGYSALDAERRARNLSVLHGGSSRDRMRLIFKGVPVIYGFSAKAPVGPVAASMLSSYFASGSSTEIGSGRRSARLLAHFAKTSMAVSSGISDADALAPLRRDYCQFSDDQLSSAQRLEFVHQLLQRDAAQTRLFLDRIEKAVTTLSESDRQAPAVAEVLDEIAHDQDARSRYLAFARDADGPGVRARMIKLAAHLGWLSPAEERAELMQMVVARLAQNTNPADVDLICGLNKNHELEPALQDLPPFTPDEPVSHAAVFACLGNEEGRQRVLAALTSRNEEDVQIAQVYLRDRPITDVNELREITTAVTRMGDSAAQVRALDTLAAQHLSDPYSLEELTRLFPTADSPAVQVAIADVLIHSDYEAIATPELVHMLREGRLRVHQGADIIDALIHRLQMK